jgi:WD40 repeat protein
MCGRNDSIQLTKGQLAGTGVGGGPSGQGSLSAADATASFKPRGVLVAHMSEHQHSVNSLSVSQNLNSWLASASSDGSVKLWGCSREGIHIDKV